MTAELSAAITSLKTAAEIAKALIGLRDAALIETKVIELNREILSAQAGALATQGAQFALLERVRELEKEIAGLKAWNTEKEKYQLAEVGRGAFAYALKEETGTSEPKHFLCPNCYQDGHKSVLQLEKRMPGAVQILYCLRCGGEINLTGVTHPQTPRTHQPNRPK